MKYTKKISNNKKDYSKATLCNISNVIDFICLPQ